MTLITGDAPRNVDFYTRVLGLRLVKKTVNQDDPTVYHLFYADEKGSAGADITFFEYPGAARGRAGPGMIHTIVWRVGAADRARLLGGAPCGRGGERRCARATASASRTPRASGTSSASSRRPMSRWWREPGDPGGVRPPGLRRRPRLRDRPRKEHCSARGHPRLPLARRLHVGGARRATRRRYAYDTAPEGRGIPGAGTVHHVAWATTIEDHDAWQQRVAEAGTARRR